MAEPKTETVKWKWLVNGALGGIALVLADYFLEWRGNQFLPWDTTASIVSNVTQMATTVGLVALLGYVLGMVRDKNTQKP